MPSLRQRIAVTKLSEILRNSKKNKNITMGRILKAAGYADSTCLRPKAVTEQKGFKALMKEIAPDDFLAKQQRLLLNAREQDTFNMPAEMSDIEIVHLIEELEGFKVRKVLRTPGLKYVKVVCFKPNGVLIDKALDKIYKINGYYAPEKQEHVISGVEVVDYGKSKDKTTI